MNIVERLQRLDTLIIEHTKPPVTAILRNELSLATEEAEAYQAASNKQDETLAKQVETIQRLMKENETFKAKPKRIIPTDGFGPCRPWEE